MKFLGGLLALFALFAFYFLMPINSPSLTEGNANISATDRYYMKKFEENAQVKGMSIKKGSSGHYSNHQTTLMYHGFLVGYYAGKFNK